MKSINRRVVAADARKTKDLPMLEAQQKNMGDKDLATLKPVWLPGDAAGAKARGILKRMIAEEEGP